MAQVKVVSFFEYLTDGAAWAAGVKRQNTYATVKCVDAIKGDKVKGYAWVPVPHPHSDKRHLAEANKEDVFGWFGEMVQAKAKFATPARLVPIPSSSATSAADVRNGATFKLAEAIASRFPRTVTVAPILWWKKPIPSARKGGPRDPAILYPLLVLSPKAAAEPRCILVDDVKTTCGHLQAAEARLRRATIKVTAAICAARTVHDEGEHPFSYDEDTFETFDPVDANAA